MKRKKSNPYKEVFSSLSSMYKTYSFANKEFSRTSFGLSTPLENKPSKSLKKSLKNKSIEDLIFDMKKKVW